MLSFRSSRAEHERRLQREKESKALSKTGNDRNHRRSRPAGGRGLKFDPVQPRMTVRALTPSRALCLFVWVCSHTSRTMFITEESSCCDSIVLATPQHGQGRHETHQGCEGVQMSVRGRDGRMEPRDFRLAHKSAHRERQTERERERERDRTIQRKRSRESRSRSRRKNAETDGGTL